MCGVRMCICVYFNISPPAFRFNTAQTTYLQTKEEIDSVKKGIDEMSGPIKRKF